MDTLVVATVQQQMQIAGSHEEYREELRRLMKAATAKQARLVVFPELGGLVVMPPLLGDFRSGLIKRAEWGRRKRAKLLDRLRGAAAGWAADWFKADLRAAFAGLLDVAAQDVWNAYRQTFSALAREFGVTIVAPSGYFPDPADGVVRNLAAVFDENGDLLGTQAKLILHPEDKDLAQPGEKWQVIPTPVGRLGLLLGNDVLIPEAGRILAYQGADLLIAQGACMDPLLYNKLRTGVLARMQDNQLFAASSYLVGRNRMSRGERSPYAGKSALFAPQELTPRKTGVLVEMTSRESVGVLTAVWDYSALRKLWDSSDTPVRQLPLEQTGEALGQLYTRMEQLPRLLAPERLPDEVSDVDLADEDLAEMSLAALGREGEDMADSPHEMSAADRKATRQEDAGGEHRTFGGDDKLDAGPLSTLTLDDLEVRSSITSRWPLDDYVQPEEFETIESIATVSPELDTSPAGTEGAETNAGKVADETGAREASDKEAGENEKSLEQDPVHGSESNSEPPHAAASKAITGEDETDEMDALPRRSS